jgi:hypothetical protein
VAHCFDLGTERAAEESRRTVITVFHTLGFLVRAGLGLSVLWVVLTAVEYFVEDVLL